MQSKVNIGTVYREAIALLLFTLPLSKQLTVLMIAIVAIASLIQGSILSESGSIRSVPPKRWMIMLYLFYFISILYSENKQNAWFDAEIKLSLLLLPLCISIKSFSENDINRLKSSFVYGNIAAIVLLTINSAYHYYLTGDTAFFFYEHFSLLIHTSYFALYLCLSIAFIIFSRSGFQNHLKYIAVGLLSAGIILCASRTGILIMAITFILWLIHSFFIEGNKLKSLIILTSLSIISLVTILSPGVSERVKEAMNTDTQSTSGPGTYELRTRIWKNSIPLIKNNPLFGVGNGDVKELITTTHANDDLSVARDWNLNSHNQFIQTTVSIGLIGLTCLIMIFISIGLNGIRNSDFTSICFVIATSVSFLFEAMLETQSGVVFFALMISLFFSNRSASPLYK